MATTLLGIDAGTTHCKAVLLALDGSSPLRLASRPTVTRRTEQGYAYYDPDELWATVAATVREVADGAHEIAAAGVASMAEAGLLLDRATGQPRSHVIPWFDTRSMLQAEVIGREARGVERYGQTGLHPSFKYGLSKLLWLRDHDAAALRGAVWLSVADYIVYRLTGRMATDYSLAARTYAFRIDTLRWDEEWIRHFEIEGALFPTARPPGSTVGPVLVEAAEGRLPVGTPVVIAGHDHVCAALAAGVVAPGPVLDSMGTAESLAGAVSHRMLGEREYRSGLSYGPHVLPGRLCWQGGLPASGGSVEWLRARLADEPLPYARVEAMLGEATDGPTGILYFPYLSGSGAPHHQQNARAAFIGLAASHTRGDLLKAVLEGTAYDVESIRRAAEEATGTAIDTIIALGGGAKNLPWLQIKADVSGCRIQVPALPEAAALGAALVAGLGRGIYRDEREALSVTGRDRAATIQPDPERHQAYRHLYERGYLPLHGPLSQYDAARIQAASP